LLISGVGAGFAVVAVTSAVVEALFESALADVEVAAEVSG